MRKIKSLMLAVVFVFAMLFQTGCIGSFKLTNSLYDWNTSLDGKAAQELVFLAMIIIPVYSVTLLIDGVILNTVEFWTGSNPMAMHENQKEVQLVENNGINYEITATKNKFHVTQLDGEKTGQSYDLVYNSEDIAWYLEANGESKKVAQYNTEEEAVNLFKPNGQIIQVDPAVDSKNAVKAAMNLELEELSRN
ncbi:MAG: DUF3332 domain-containing protein [Bacteroidales bacterium]|nr:DUF3332 domain-containing protein [Bacteroidales bacterium]MCF8404876.1 DUF3332 domain-containing protein [Bacteroidales bacterium]